MQENGYNVILNYNKSERNAVNLQKTLADLGHYITIYKADVSNREEVNKMVEYVSQKFKNIDVLINNAGIAKLQLFSDSTDEDWDEIMNTNLRAAFYTIQATLPNMIHNKNGLILNISSIWGMTGASCESLYSISKAGLDGMTKALAKELGPSNIRVNSIAPGIIDTEMNNKIDEKIKEKLKEETPLGKIGKPIDIYKCAKWLIEDEFTTGQIISPNGGYLI